jgi:hypothetical protein
MPHASPRESAHNSPASDILTRNGADAGCTSRHQNAHVTESRVVTYPWHPWHGRSVFIFAAVTKGDEPVFRGALEQADLARPLEVPQWMFDAATCCRTSLTATPSASIAAIRALDALLHLTAASVASAVIKAEHRSRSATGGAYATPARSTPTRSTDAVSSEADCAAVAESSGRGPQPHTSTSRAVSPASSPRTARRAGGAR